MYRIQHGDAVSLELIVRRLFKCDREGVSGLADADNFEYRPMDAAVMIVSYIYAKELDTDEKKYHKFLDKYDTIFNYPDENNAANEVKNYITELERIVDMYL